MRRAVLVLLLVAALPRPAHAAEKMDPVDAVAMIDYQHGAKFKVGDWVRYETKGVSHQGYKTDYSVTILIAGEEMWWGEKCFWVETRNSFSGQDPEITASLLSYAIFEDPLPSARFGRYVRKFVEGIDDKGKYMQQPFRRPPAEISNRAFAETNPEHELDTLGIARVEVPKGTFDALRVRKTFRAVETAQVGDSTVYWESVQAHTYSWSDQVPITHLVSIDQENTQRRRVWMIGESENAPLQIVEQVIGGTKLVDFGSGMKSISVPERFQRPLSEQQSRPPKPGPGAAPKPAGKRG
jgi:hypothetical protein